MTIAARLEITELRADRRGARRRRLALGTSLQSGDQVTIHDISATGMLIETAADLAAFDRIEVQLPEVGATSALVIWNSGRFFGCEFDEPVSRGTLSAALLRSPTERSHPQPTKMPQAGADEDPDSSVEEAPEEKKATLTVRLRVILGGALFLWLLIYLAISALFRLFR
jgi:hypothetical protein